MSSIKTDDPVVKEIPVFLSQTLADKLYIFQYPIRPASEGYDNTTFLQSHIKPENQQVRIELMVDTDSVTYDHSKGEQIALNADSGIKNEPEDKDKAFNSHLMDKLILDSSRVLSDCSHYAVGIFQDGELHVTPLKSIIQIRPQFDYLDNSEKRAKEEAKMTGDDEEEEDSPKAVNVTFARQKPEFLKKLQEQSFQQHSKKTSEEKWIPTNYVPANSTQAELTRLEMFCPLVDESVNTLNITKSQYLELLAPPLKAEEHSKMSILNHTTSLSYIRTLPLLDQIKILLKDAKVISFGQLRTIIASEHDTSSILKYLQQVAVLVQGNWIVNSELIYPKDSVSSHNGIPAELMCRARDYILLSFLENEYLDRKAISNVIKLPPEEIRDIFTNLARHQPKKGWQLIIPPNTEFPMRYPDIAQRQEMFWEAKQKQLREVMDAQHQTPQQGVGKSGKTGKVREHPKPGKVKDK